MMKKVSNVKKFIKENFKYLIIILVLSIFAILVYFGIVAFADGTSMNHSSFSATNGFGFIISNPFTEPQRGDVVKIRPRGSKEGLNKRLIAIPGDTVRITNEKVYVNGEELIEEYAFYDHMYDQDDYNYVGYTLDELKAQLRAKMPNIKEVKMKMR